MRETDGVEPPNGEPGEAGSSRTSPTPHVPLQYYSPHEPERARGRGVAGWSVLLLASWAPYLCGVINASTVSTSYVRAISSAHANAAVAGFLLGMLMAAASAAGFVRLRHWPGAAAAGAVLIIQASLVVCVGLAG